jgi:hypothetical protein
LGQGGEDWGGERPGDARFQITGTGQVFVFFYVGGTNAQGKAIAENRLVELADDGKPGESVIVTLQNPLSTFFSATVRAGCRPSNILDLLGNANNSMRYARIRLQ